jgi:preprotein translocase subunit SecD
VQVSSGKATLKIDGAMVPRIEQALAAAGVKADFVQFEGNSVKARFGDTDTQIKAKDEIVKALNPDPADPSYIVALNLLSRSPHWLTSLHALPMYLGLDLRGGVHFLLQVDAGGADQEGGGADWRHPHAGCATRTSATPVSPRRQRVDVRFRDRDADGCARPAGRPTARLQWSDAPDGATSLQRCAQAGSRRVQETRQGRTSPRCTAASMNSASPSR